QIERLRKIRRERDEVKVRALLEKLRRTYERDDRNSIYPMMEAVKAYATLGEVIQVGREIFGTWKEPVLI
ncbi:MAG: methylmalonyl-CoA mutase, partial [Thaumarchaeota archaeon]|nr:methylmalonyl-CoA mutase [Nitrososphaerota archaeon]